jgi:hypothetical protein
MTGGHAASSVYGLNLPGPFLGGEVDLAPSGGGGSSQFLPGGASIIVNNSFSQPPPDPHAWSNGIQFELGALA